MPVSPELQAKFFAELDRRGLRGQYDSMLSRAKSDKLKQAAMRDVGTLGSLATAAMKPWEAAVGAIVNSAVSGSADGGDRGIMDQVADLFTSSSTVKTLGAFLSAPAGAPSAVGAIPASRAYGRALREHPIITPLETALDLYGVRSGVGSLTALGERRAAYGAAAQGAESELLQEAITGRRAAQDVATQDAFGAVARKRAIAEAEAQRAKALAQAEAYDARISEDMAALTSQTKSIGEVRTRFRSLAEDVARVANEHIGATGKNPEPLNPLQLRRLAEQVRLEMANRKMFPVKFPAETPYPRRLVEEMFSAIPERVSTGGSPAKAITADEVLEGIAGNKRIYDKLQGIGVDIPVVQIGKQPPLALPAPKSIYGEGFTMDPGNLVRPRLEMKRARVGAGGVRDLSRVRIDPRLSKGAVEFRPQGPPEVHVPVSPTQPKAPFSGESIAADAEPITAEVFVPENGRAMFRGGYAGEIFKRVKNQAQSPHSKYLVASTQRVISEHHNLAGRMLEQLRDIRISRQPLDMRLKVGSELRGASTGDPAAKVMASRTRTILDEMADRAEKSGIQVEMPDGTTRPWSRRTDYFPRMMLSEVREALFDDSRKIVNQAVAAIKKTTGTGSVSREHIEATINRLYEAKQLKLNQHTSDAIEALMKSNTAKTPAQAMNYLGRRASQEKFRFFGNVDAARTSPLPKHFFETDPSKVLPEYIYGASRRLAEAETWGGKSQQVLESLAKISAENPQEGKFFEEVMDIFVGNKDREFYQKNPSLAKLYERYIDYSVATKIGLGTAIIPNATQLLISSVPATGLMNNAKGAMKIIFDPAYRAQIRSYGPTVSEAMRHLMQVEFGGTEGKISSLLTTPFQGVNKALKYISAASMDQAWDDIVVAAQRGDKGALRTLNRLGVSPQEAATKAGRQRGIFNFASSSQLQKNILEEPLIMNQPALRPALLFKRFGVRQAGFIKDWVWDEITSGNVAPFLRLMAGGYAGGKFVKWAKEGLRSTLTGMPTVKRDDPMWRDAVDAYSQVGALGTFGDLMRIYGDLPEDIATNLIDNAVFAITPLPVSDAVRVKKVATKFAQEAGRRGIPIAAARAGREAMGQFMGPLAGQAMQGLRGAGEREDMMRSRQGSTQQKINTLYGRNDFQTAIKMFKGWNEAFPQYPVHLPEPEDYMNLRMKDAMLREGASSSQVEEVLNSGE